MLRRREVSVQETAVSILAELANNELKGQPFTIEFVSNAAGEVEKLVLDTGDQKMEAKKTK